MSELIFNLVFQWADQNLQPAQVLTLTSWMMQVQDHICSVVHAACSGAPLG